MNLNIQSPQDINYLKQLLASGAITEGDLANMSISGSSNPQNALAQIVNPPVQPTRNVYSDAQNPGPASGPQFDPAAPTDALRSQGAQFIRNESTGQTQFLAPQPSQPAQSQQMRVIGAGNGQITDLGSEPAKAVPIDSTRPQIDIPGVGRASYGADGNAYINNPDGSKTKILLGYDAQGSAKLNQQALERQLTQARIAQSQEAVAASQQARSQSAGLSGLGTPQAVLEKQFGKAPEGQRWTVNGTLEPIPGAAPKPLTEFQGKSEAFGARAAAANEILSAVGQGGKVQPGYIKRSLEAIPFVGGALGTLANVTQSEDQQRVEQAQRDFVNAVLRQESGAVISPTEFDNASKQYFPQPGDSPQVVEQKRQNRERVIASFADSAGPARQKVIDSGVKARASFAEALPLPTNKSALIPGQSYRTSRGVAVWNGTNFEN